jgi:hypothetical protein
MLEVMLISESKKDVNVRSSEVIKENQEEADALFEDFEVSEDLSAEDEEFINNEGKDFMKNGFQGVKN